jgi:hypothetical protein
MMYLWNPHYIIFGPSGSGGFRMTSCCTARRTISPVCSQLRVRCDFLTVHFGKITIWYIIYVRVKTLNLNLITQDLGKLSSWWCPHAHLDLGLCVRYWWRWDWRRGGPARRTPLFKLCFHQCLYPWADQATALGISETPFICPSSQLETSLRGFQWVCNWFFEQPMSNQRQIAGWSCRIGPPLA